MNADGWDAYLRAFHADYPDATEAFFGAFPVEGEARSYDLLAAEARRENAAPDVVDLGCGAGALTAAVLRRLPAARVVGADFTAAEIDRAVARHGTAARFVCAPASALPLPDASVDVVLSHMALMLMTPVEPVIAEIGRVLRPGGRIAAIVGGGPFRDAPEPLPTLAAIVSRYKAPFIPDLSGLAIADARTRDAGAFAALLRESGIPATVTARPLAMRIACRADAIWATIFGGMYFSETLDPAARTAVAAESATAARPFAGSDGMVRVDFPLTLIRADLNRASDR